MKIRNKIMFIFLMIAMLNFVAGYYCVHKSQEIVTRVIGTERAALAEGALDAIDRDIYYKIERWMSYVAIASPLREALSLSNQEFGKITNVQEYIDGREEIWRLQANAASFSSSASFMEGIIDNEISEGLRERAGFYNQKYGYNLVGEIFVTNKYGTNIAETAKTSDYYQADEQWWQEARENGVYVEGFQYDESADIHSLAICIRIEDETGDCLGIMKVVINIEEYVNTIKEMEEKLIINEKNGTGNNIHLIGEDNRCIFSIGEKKEKFLFASMLKKDSMDIAERQKGYFISKDDSSDKGGIFVVYAFSQGYREYKGIGWILVIEQQAKDIVAPIAKIKQLLLFVSIGISVFAIIIGFFTAHAIAFPLESLKKASCKVAMGLVGTQVKIRAKDEIGDLAQSFNEMASEIERLHLGMEQEISNKTMSLQNKIKELRAIAEELRNAQESLSRSEKLAIIGKLSGIVSHELRGPLSIIKNSIYSLKVKFGEDIDEETSKHLKIMNKAVVIADNIITDILDFVRQASTAREVVDINAIIEKTLSDPDVGIPENITVQVDLAKDLPNAEGSPSQIRQVLLNLITNANQAMSGRGALAIRTSSEKGKILINVSDNGPGIEKENLGKIFEPLFSTKTKGIGLGLPTCSTIIEAHKGQITVESTVGEGATFIVKLPIYVKE